jgi:hypothetical protein
MKIESGEIPAAPLSGSESAVVAVLQVALDGFLRINISLEVELLRSYSLPLRFSILSSAIEQAPEGVYQGFRVFLVHSMQVATSRSIDLLLVAYRDTIVLNEIHRFGWLIIGVPQVQFFEIIGIDCHQKI